MRKALTTIIALALVLGMTQCKKKDVIAPISNEGLFITFSANSNQGNTKTEFNPSYSKFVWSSGVEYINVGGSESGYLGQISGDGKNEYDTDIHREFSGSITAPQPGETLYFFYLGKGDHAGATSIDFADQTGNLSDVTNKHIAIGSTVYTGQTHFTATLSMAMSIACFNTEVFVDGSNNPETVYLYGEDIFSSANINYRNGTISGSAKSYICTGKANEERYVALIPGTANNPVSTCINFVSKSHGGSIYFNGGIGAQTYYAHTSGEPGLEVVIDPSVPGLVDDPYSFSVSSAKQVQFSKGNLQYKPSTETWRFAEHQYDMAFAIASDGVVYSIDDDYYDHPGVVTAEEYFAYDGDDCSSLSINVSSHYTSSSTAYIDMFGLGAWGSSTPYNTSTTNDDYSWNDFNVTIGGVDEWRILSKGEWDYLLNDRTDAEEKWSYATVNSVRGIVLLPDSWTLPAGLTFIPGEGEDPDDSDAQWNNNTYTEAQWTLMEANGAIFLPAAGYRSKNNSSGEDNILRAACWEGFGYYWTKTQYTNPNYYYTFKFETGYDGVETVKFNKCRGCSVRLVRDVE